MCLQFKDSCEAGPHILRSFAGTDMVFDSLSYVVDDQASSVAIIEFPIVRSLVVDFHIRLRFRTHSIFFDSTDLQRKHHLALPSVIVRVCEMIVKLRYPGILVSLGPNNRRVVWFIGMVHERLATIRQRSI